MITFYEAVLANGLKVVVHPDPGSQMAVLDIVYNVGSKHELPTRTGFAHLFEHLMFEGSINVPHFDEQVQKAGGENNAFTSPDITNYYISLPVRNIETAFWVESDRLLGLNLTPEVIETQKKVVIEEFKQRYLNQPYGDLWLKLRPLAYKKHSYRWPTIGASIEHIEQATPTEVVKFFERYYSPKNATLIVAGGIEPDAAFKLAEKWFGGINRNFEGHKPITPEPKQTEKRFLEIKADVPANAIYKAYHIPERTHPDYFAYDLIGDILGRGASSRLNSELVNKKQAFTSIDAYNQGSFDPGLLVIEGKVADGYSVEQANKDIDEVLKQLIEQGPKPQELEKVKNQAESTVAFSEVELMQRTIHLAQASVLGNPNLINEELNSISMVNLEQVKRITPTLFEPKNESLVFYLKDEKTKPSVK